jgi:molybdopterin-guanine dinucleotide biosynthesis protein A
MGKLTVAVMAGGKSSRMGTDKSFVRLLGKPLIEHVLERLDEVGAEETLLITNRLDDYAYLGLPMYTDVLPDKGSLGGIYTAVYYSSSDYTLVVACDMPFVNPALLCYMVGLCDGSCDVIVPRVQEYPQGLHAIYNKACELPIRARRAADLLKIIGFYPDVRVRYIDEPEYERFDPRGLSFYNVNTPEELEEAHRLLDDLSE